MRNTITYAGVNSASVGLVVEKFPSMNRPARKFDKVSVKGRNGDIYFMQDAFSNVEQDYEIWCPKGQFSDVLNFLYPEERGTTVEDILRLEVNGYKQLQDSYDPNVTRLACVTNGFDVENLRNRYARATITFDCRPERFRSDAFEFIDIGSEQTTKSGEIVTFDPAVIIEAGQGKNKADVDDTTVTDSRYFADLTDLTPSGTYTISFDYVRTGEVTIAIVTSTYNYFPLTATSGRFSGTVTATTMGTISVACDEITGSLSVSKFQCEEGSEATEYEPYELITDLKTAPYVQSLTASINAVQNLNGYDKPWVGGSGKNKLNPEASVQGKYVNQNGAVVTDARFAYTELIPVSEGSYVFSFTATDAEVSNCRVHAYNTNGTWIRQLSATAVSSVGYHTVPITVPSDVPNIVITYSIAYWKDYQLEVGSTATTYEPYENICPISGWDAVNVRRTGANIYGGSWLRYSSTQIKTQDAAVIVKPNTSYYVVCPQGCTLSVYGRDKDGNSLGVMPTTGKVFTTTDTCVVCTVYVDNYPTPSAYANDVSINYPSTDTVYHSYTGTTTTISLGSTCYGGTLDVTNGVLTINYAMVDLGTLPWAYESSNKFFYAILDFAFNRTDLITEKYVSIGNKTDTQMASVEDGSFSPATYASGTKTMVKFKNRAYTDVASFTASVDGDKLVYPLRESQTVTLTPTQVQTVLGENNIWADSGTVTVVINKPIENPSPRNARPCLKVYGSGAGTVVCNGYVVNISNIPQYIYIDSDSQNCFKEISDANLNNLVTLTSGFPVLSAGGNSISWSGGVTNVEVMPRWWSL